MALEIPPEKKNATKLDTSLLPLNHSKILIPYIQAMAAAPFALEAVQMEKNGKAWNILEIGLGTGILNSFLHDVFSSMNITTIELEEGMYEIAKKYFGLVEDNYNKIIVGDGLLYLQKTAGQSKFDVIFIDACYNTVVEVMCPVEAFLMKENLKIIKEALTKNGIVVISVLTFEDDKLSEVLACGEFRRNKSRFAKKLKEIYEKFEFYSEPNIE
uniref:Methyltransferase domain-containing protein n=1 Tax=Elaeophora elaphi TaxID=1147741 RepID=A0A0R3RSQ1_9BILA